MKILIIIFFLSFLIANCSKRKQLPLIEKIERFEVSECQNGCGIDSVGIRKNENKNGNLNVRLGYIANCSWRKAYLKNITEQNDTLLIELDRPHSIDGEYPITTCHCFFYFNFVIKDYTNTPKTIRILELFENNKYWDERDFDRYEIEEVEEIIIDKK